MWYLIFGMVGLVCSIYLWVLVFPQYRWFRRMVGGVWYFIYTKTKNENGGSEIIYSWTKETVPLQFILNVEKYESEQD